MEIGNKKNLKSKVSYILKKWITLFLVPFSLVFFYLLSIILNIFPIKLSSQCLAWLLQVLKVRAHVIENNLKKAFPHWSNEERIQFTHKYYTNAGRIFVDIVRIFTLLPRQIRQQTSWSPGSYEKIKRALEEGHGLILLGAHLGNWERAALSLSVHGFPIYLIVKKQSFLPTQLLISLNRKRFGLKVLYSGKIFRQMIKALNKNQIVVLVLDQHQPGKTGIRVNFFNNPASTSYALAKLMKRVKAPILPIATYQCENGHQIMKVNDAVSYQKAVQEIVGTRRAQLEEEFLNTQAYAREIEQLVLHRPEQWLWMHRRWKVNQCPLPEEKPYLENE